MDKIIKMISKGGKSKHYREFIGGSRGFFLFQANIDEEGGKE
jgi:hypothetical protein